MGKRDFYIEGEPVSYSSGQREKVWKDKIEKTLKEPEGDNMGMVLQFTIQEGRHIDLDNLCDPVFSAVVGRKRWFDGKRPNIDWWRAKKREGNDQGLRIWIKNAGDSVLDKIEKSGEGDVLSGVYPSEPSGNLPESLNDRTYSSWVENSRKAQIAEDISARFIVRLEFGEKAGRRRNLGDISSSSIKAIIDGMHPIFGREDDKRRGPKDWKVVDLQVERGVRGVEEDHVQIDVWRA